MRGFFSGNRQSAPLGPPKSPSSSSPARRETLQAIRLRQREKQRHFIMQMLRAEKERDLLREQGETERAAEVDASRAALNDAADALGQQVLTFERIMEEVGLTLDLEEEARANLQRLEESREMYDAGVVEAEEIMRERAAQGEYISTMASPFMMPSDVYDEDEAMRDLDECARQTGRT